MSELAFRRVGGACGIGFILLWIISEAILGDLPTGSDSSETVIRFYTDHSDDLQLSGYLIGFAALALLGFVAALQRMLREERPDDRYWADVATLAGGTSAVLVLAGFGVAIAPAVRAENLADPVVVRMFLDAGSLLVDGMFLFSTALFVGAVSAVMARMGSAYRWIGVGGLGLSVLLVIGAGSIMTTSGALAADAAFGRLIFLIFGVWCVANGVMLLSGARQRARVSQPTPA